MNKDLIRKRFAKNLSTYNENARIQEQMSEKLLSFADKNEYENILEIGCGTGLLTQKTFEKFLFKNYIANDIVEDCSKYIQSISPEINFICDDAENFIKNDKKKYDLILSNAVFQWIENFEEFIFELINKLNTGGSLLFSTFGTENFREIYHVLGKTLPYKSVKDYQEIFKTQNFIIEEEIRILAFKSSKDILKHIKNTGVNALNETYWTKTDMSNFEKGYNNFCSGSPTLTYNPIYIKITK